MPSESSVKKPSAAAGSGAGSPRQSSAASAAAVGSALPKRKTASAASSSETPAVAAGLRRRESSEGSAPQDRGTPSRESTSPQGLQAQLAEAPSSASPLRSFRTSGSGQSPEKANGSKPNSPEKASSSKPNSPEKAAASSGEQQVSAASSGSAGLAFSPPDRASLGADAPGAEFQDAHGGAGGGKQNRVQPIQKPFTNNQATNKSVICRCSLCFSFLYPSCLLLVC
ncbi:unnamed protein product [Polarella glacialis]|uniref:Uncharacterized protein n=1 Tax=Polarella glacialis TaxID=89957 RepID=A0A813GY93_POLGL|nr:unnamed protein product [Polarella glacialis]CAE8743573.1 unnamed protein product [Polarella glacialis]